VEDQAGNDRDLEVIFKQGKSEKLLREKANIERWERLLPGLPPRVLEYRHSNGDAGLLLEFLDGLTFHDIVLSADAEMVERAMELIQETLRKTWIKTKKEQAVNARFSRQLSSRVADVFRVHPEFRKTNLQVGRLAMQPYEEMVAQAGELEEELSARFSVLVHGDFNTDNVIYNHRHDKIHFIDLHRSDEMDYVQDVSVFLVSNFRMPVFDSDVRGRLNDVILSFYEFGRGFADQHDDATFDARLALGLARSFMTSTRFELNEDFAKVMQLRSVYLLEKLLEHRGRSWDGFRLASETLTY
jgi:hypothetical protein